MDGPNYGNSLGLRTEKFYDGEFDPGSERTLAARFKHASRAGIRGNLEESGGRVSNTWIICPLVWDSLMKVSIIPDKTFRSQELDGKGAKASLKGESASH